MKIIVEKLHEIAFSNDWTDNNNRKNKRGNTK